MQLYSIRGSTKEELEAKRYNIGVGVSLGNKWFTPENVLELTKWSLKYTRESVVVYIADTLHAINIEVRQAQSPENAREIARKKGQVSLREIQKLFNSEFSPEQLGKISYVTWDNLVDEKFKQKLVFLYSYFEKDQNFRNRLVEIIRGFVSREARSFSGEKLIRLSHYIIEELPELVNRVKIGDIFYDAYAYPYDTEVTRLIDNIQKGTEFPEIKEVIMDTEPKIFLEVRYKIK
ncbi:MAG: tRNA-dependent cyclodipeptide synthase [Parcubacteria group bacterium]|jgi:tRNA-dependent cyclodipeptide synthase